MQAHEQTKPAFDLSFVTHMDTRHLRWATSFAAVIAFSKRRDELVPSDLLAGIYVANWERVFEFWPQPQTFEDFVAQHCDWSEPRWMTWRRFQDEERRAVPESRFRLRLLFRGRPLGKRRLSGSRFKQSSDWKLLFEAGEKLAPYTASCCGRVLPLLTPEIMLLAFARTEGIALHKPLQESGLMVDKLEEAALRHIDNPEKLMF